MSARPAILAALCLVLPLGGCDDMSRQDKDSAYGSVRTAPGPVPDGIVRYGDQPRVVPAVTLALLQRGQERYRIYCAPCHSELGDGHGIIVARGFPAPPNYEEERLRAAPPSFFFDTITNGHGVMYSFAQRIPPADRWAIVAYIRALQLSQHASLADLTPAQRNAAP
ncbi:c-type cytochrome [Rhodopila sp.]|uniref:c-type cytochrome n=1 Tax=Rhodopila sp. TaxID=2480087 RepID=UPI002C9A75D4|nr:cytochrome c [Rhodopila sp.]HVZ10294.1 cytochrome c [Rhodopila sp.]